MSNDGPRDRAAREAVGLLRAARKAALATLDRGDGGPYASLVLVAAAADGAPILLLSQLAAHTRNIAADPRASLLIEPAAVPGVLVADAMASSRVSLTGRLAISTRDGDSTAFLAAHPAAEAYAAFADFAFHRFEIGAAHVIGGFGRITDLAPEDLVQA